MKPPHDKMSDKEAAEYFATHEMGEADENTEEVEFEVKRPLSAVLSIRLDQEHLKKLKQLARAQEVGVTTLARRLLTKALDNPGAQLFMRAMDDAAVKDVLARTFDPDPEALTHFDGPMYTIISKEGLRAVGWNLGQHMARLMVQTVLEKAPSANERNGVIEWAKTSDLLKEAMAPDPP